MNVRVVSLTALIFVSSCQTRQRMGSNPSGSNEPAQVSERPESLGITSTPGWQDLKDRLQADVSPPWSDSAWTLASNGLARRWQLRESALGAGVSANPLTPHQQISEMRAALMRKDAPALALLSPAEKYDILATGADVPASRLAAMETAQARFESLVPSGFKDKRAQLVRLQEEALKESVRVQALLSERRLLVIESELARRRNLEEPGPAELSELQKLSSEAKAASARQRELERQASEVASDIKHLLKPVQEPLLGELRAIKPFLPLTALSWEQWLLYATNRYDDGRRLGHQHGWAPASLLHPSPRHGVLARKGDLEIFFTEGDIRALLSKLYAEQGPRQRAFVTARCQDEPVALPQRSSRHDGILCRGRKSGSCTTAGGGQEIYLKNNRIEDGLITFSDFPWDDASRVGVVEKDLGQDYYVMNVFNSSATFESWFQSGGQVGHFEKSLLHLTKGCRGTSPLAFHLALTKLIADGTGIVLEETLGGLVWRHPTYRYKLAYLPIILNKKDPSGRTISKPGEPAAIADIADVFRAYRAPKTAFLLQIQATLFLAEESEPRVSYADMAETPAATRTMTYTLELDDKMVPVGGQWGLLPLPARAALSKDADDVISGEGPDRLWYYSRGDGFEQGPLHASLIMKLHECSRKGPLVDIKGQDNGSGQGAQARVCNF